MRQHPPPARRCMLTICLVSYRDGYRVRTMHSPQSTPINFTSMPQCCLCHPGVKYKPPGFIHFEEVFYFLNIALFLLNTSTLLIHFILYPRQPLRLIKDPVKGIFVPLLALSFATTTIGTIDYGQYNGSLKVRHLLTTTQPSRVVSSTPALFWIYLILSLIISLPMLMIWFNNPHDLKTFTPAWAFLTFPMMLVGVVAFNVLKVIPPEEPRAVGVLLVG